MRLTIRTRLTIPTISLSIVCYCEYFSIVSIASIVGIVSIVGLVGLVGLVSLVSLVTSNFICNSCSKIIRHHNFIYYQL